jgi:hypothetical protein
MISTYTGQQNTEEEEGYAFISCTGFEPVIPALDGLKTMRILDNAYFFREGGVKRCRGKRELGRPSQR